MLNEEEKELRVMYLCQQMEPHLKKFRKTHNERRGLEFFEFLTILK